jgi:hypothetical protein
LYENATIDGRLTYRIQGTRGTVDHVGFGTQVRCQVEKEKEKRASNSPSVVQHPPPLSSLPQAGQYGKPGGLRTVDYKEADDLVFSQDGSFELIVGPEKPKGCVNFLRTEREPPQGGILSPEMLKGPRPAGASPRRGHRQPRFSSAPGLIILRQTFGRRELEEPLTCTISIVDGSNAPTPLTCERLEDALSSTGLFVTGGWVRQNVDIKMRMRTPEHTPHFTP